MAKPGLQYPKHLHKTDQVPLLLQYASEPTPLRRPNTYPKVLTFGRGNIAPLSNRTNAPIGCGHRLNIDQTCQKEKETSIAVVPPSDKIIHTDRVQTYDEIPALVRPRHLLANWTSIRLGDDPNRPTVDENIIRTITMEYVR